MKKKFVLCITTLLLATPILFLLVGGNKSSTKNELVQEIDNVKVVKHSIPEAKKTVFVFSLSDKERSSIDVVKVLDLAVRKYIKENKINAADAKDSMITNIEKDGASITVISNE